MKKLTATENKVIACGQQYGLPAPSYIKFEDGQPMRPDHLTPEQADEYATRIAVYMQHEQLAFVSQTKTKIDSIQFWVKLFGILTVISLLLTLIGRFL